MATWANQIDNVAGIIITRNYSLSTARNAANLTYIC